MKKNLGTQEIETDVLVAGGGPAGLFAALALADLGLAVTVATGPDRGTIDRRTTALLDGSVKALDALGVWDRLRPAAAPLRTMRLVDDTGRLVRAPVLSCDSTEIDLDAFGYNVENAMIVAALADTARERGVAYLAESVGAVETGPERAFARLSSGGHITARLVVAADGRNSGLRETAGIEVDMHRYPQAAVTATLRHSRPHGDVSTEFHTATGPCTLVPLPGERSSLVCVVTPAEAGELLALDDPAFARVIEKRVHAILGKLAVEGPRGRFDLVAMTARCFSAERLALVGETAHVVPPIGAQGLNIGLRDGAALADTLATVVARGGDPGEVEALAAYDRARRADIVTRTLAVDALNQSLLSPFMPIHAMRGLGLWAMDRIAPLRRAFMREGLQPADAPRLMRGERPGRAA